VKKIHQLILENLSKIAKKESGDKDFIEGSDTVAIKLIQDLLAGNTVSTSDIENSIGKIASKKKQ